MLPGCPPPQPPPGTRCDSLDAYMSSRSPDYPTPRSSATSSSAGTPPPLPHCPSGAALKKTTSMASARLLSPGGATPGRPYLFSYLSYLHTFFFYAPGSSHAREPIRVPPPGNCQHARYSPTCQGRISRKLSEVPGTCQNVR